MLVNVIVFQRRLIFSIKVACSLRTSNFWSWFFKMVSFLQNSVFFSIFWCFLHSSDPKNKKYDGFFFMIFTQLFDAVFKSASPLFIWVTSPPSRPTIIYNLQSKRRQTKFWKKIPPTPPHCALRAADNTALSVHFQGLNNCTVIKQIGPSLFTVSSPHLDHRD